MQTSSCEVCSSPMGPWTLGQGNILLRCSDCGHLVRSLELCRAHARRSAWGGSTYLDAIRLAITCRRLTTLGLRRKRLKVLEIGIGSGSLTSKLARCGHDVTGLDENLSRVPGTLADQATLLECAAENVVLPEHHYDLIVAIHVVEHLQTPVRVLTNCRRALRPGGILYVVTPNGASSALRVFKDSWWYLEDPTHLQFFTPASMDRALTRAGFKGISTRPAWWDSINLESKSVLRRLWPTEYKAAGWGPALILTTALLPVTMAARLLLRNFSPSLEVVATCSNEFP